MTQSSVPTMLPPHLSAARMIVESVHEGINSSEFSHSNQEINGHYAFNCYGFIAHVLNNTSLRAYSRVLDYMENNKATVPVSIDGIPCPFNFSYFFNSLSKDDEDWFHVEDMSTLKEGDFIVYLPPQYVPQTIEKMPTGKPGIHIMLVDNVVDVKENLVILEIIDCTQHHHGETDTRYQTQKGGLGCSRLTLHRTDAGNFIQWGNPDKKGSPLIPKEIVVGRIKY